MWLFTGRYRDLAPEICLIAFLVASFGSVFLLIAVRHIRRSDVTAGKVVSVLLAVTAITTISGSLGFGEPVFIPPHSLVRGSALLVAIAGALLGLVGTMLSKRARLLRVLILLIAAGVLFGDLTGWLRRSAGVSKFDAPAGMLDLPSSTGASAL